MSCVRPKVDCRRSCNGARNTSRNLPPTNLNPTGTFSNGNDERQYNGYRPQATSNDTQPTSAELLPWSAVPCRVVPVDIRFSLAGGSSSSLAIAAYVDAPACGTGGFVASTKRVRCSLRCVVGCFGVPRVRCQRAGRRKRVSHGQVKHVPIKRRDVTSHENRLVCAVQSRGQGVACGVHHTVSHTFRLAGRPLI